MTVDDPADTTCQHFDVEIDQQAEGQVEQFEVSE
jgi:hypothetical protein